MNIGKLDQSRRTVGSVHFLSFLWKALCTCLSSALLIFLFFRPRRSSGDESLSDVPAAVLSVSVMLSSWLMSSAKRSGGCIVSGCAATRKSACTSVSVEDFLMASESSPRHWMTSESRRCDASGQAQRGIWKKLNILKLGFEIGDWNEKRNKHDVLVAS